MEEMSRELSSKSPCLTKIIFSQHHNQWYNNFPYVFIHFSLRLWLEVILLFSLAQNYHQLQLQIYSYLSLILKDLMVSHYISPCTQVASYSLLFVFDVKSPSIIYLIWRYQGNLPSNKARFVIAPSYKKLEATISQNLKGKWY